jgi:UMP-CMP kinase
MTQTFRVPNDLSRAYIYIHARNQIQKFIKVAKVKELIFLDVDADTARERALASASAGVDEYQVSKAIQRFTSQTEQVINHYAKLGLCRTVDASLPLEDASARFRQALTPGVVFLAGPSARARAAVGARLQAEFNYVRLSPDELMKCELQRPTPTAALVSSLLRKRQIVPVDVTLQLVVQAMRASGSRRILVDNFPVAADQVRAFEGNVGTPAFVLYLDSGSDADGVRQHLTATDFKGSSDADAVEAAVQAFESLTRPVIEQYEALGKVRAVNATLSEDDLYREAQRHFKPVLVPLIGSKLSQKDLVTTLLGRKHGFTRVDVPGIQDAEAETQSRDGAVIKLCRAQSRTVPTDVTLRLLRRAIFGSGNTRFLLDGFPQQVSEGYPLAHDQLFAVEDKLAPLSFALHCTADAATQRSLARNPAEVEAESDRFSRENQCVLDFLLRAGSITPVVSVDTSGASANDTATILAQAKLFPEAIHLIIDS